MVLDWEKNLRSPRPHIPGSVRVLGLLYMEVPWPYALSLSRADTSGTSKEHMYGSPVGHSDTVHTVAVVTNMTRSGPRVDDEETTLLSYF